MDTKGFTLVELLLVILVMAILTGIAIPAYWLVSARTKETATESEMMNIAKALEIHNTDHMVYPLSGEYPGVLEDNGYMSLVPTRDAWGNNYGYDSDGIEYTLTSRGIDGIGGNGDDISVSNGALIRDGAYNN